MCRNIRCDVFFVFTEFTASDINRASLHRPVRARAASEGGNQWRVQRLFHPACAWSSAAHLAKAKLELFLHEGHHLQGPVVCCIRTEPAVWAGGNGNWSDRDASFHQYASRCHHLLVIVSLELGCKQSSMPVLHAERRGFFFYSRA